MINFVDATNDANHYTKPPPTKLVLIVFAVFHFSGVPERRAVRLLHGPIQHAVGTHQVSRLAHDVPTVYGSINRLRTASQGTSTAFCVVAEQSVVY